MIANPGFPKMTPAEYLEWEAVQPLRYEYFDGDVVAMTGGTIPHSQVAVNLAAVLKAHLRGKGYKVLGTVINYGYTAFSAGVSAPSLVCGCGRGNVDTPMFLR